MTIKHVLKDGTVVQSISGHVVSTDNSAYEILKKGNEHGQHSKQEQNCSSR